MTDPSPAETTPAAPAAQPEPDTSTPRPAVAVEQPAEPAEVATLREQAQQLTAQAEAAQQRAEAAELDLARLTVVRAANLPDALAARLRGTTEQELAADATALAEVISALVTAAVPAPRAPAGRPPVETLRPAASAPAEPVTDTPEQISRLVWGK
ncbi:hypothetical protein [Amycolatopsis samaneae]|uniref:Scaffolding protein n=1 Tax=Amycolatopsis samaneae TaxID=664691 RepID=A0ABW5GAW3_9PSEU